MKVFEIHYKRLGERFVRTELVKANDKDEAFKIIGGDYELLQVRVFKEV